MSAEKVITDFVHRVVVALSEETLDVVASEVDFGQLGSPQAYRMVFEGHEVVVDDQGLFTIRGNELAKDLWVIALRERLFSAAAERSVFQDADRDARERQRREDEATLVRQHQYEALALQLAPKE